MQTDKYSSSNYPHVSDSEITRSGSSRTFDWKLVFNRILGLEFAISILLSTVRWSSPYADSLSGFQEKEASWRGKEGKRMRREWKRGKRERGWLERVGCSQCLGQIKANYINDGNLRGGYTQEIALVQQLALTRAAGITGCRQRTVVIVNVGGSVDVSSSFITVHSGLTSCRLAALISLTAI